MSVGGSSVATVFLASPEIIDAIGPFLDYIATALPPRLARNGGPAVPCRPDRGGTGFSNDLPTPHWGL